MPLSRWFRAPARRPKARDVFRPQLEVLEDRTAPSRGLTSPAPADAGAAVPPDQGQAATPDRSTGVSTPPGSQSQPQLLTDLATQRHFIDYAPSGYPGSPFNPQLPGYPAQNDVSTAQITSDLQTLYNEGWRGIVTYSMDGNLQNVPQIAHQVGFTDVIVGISNQTVQQWNTSTNTWTGGTPPQEYQDLINVLNSPNGQYVNGVSVGNEGLFDQSANPPLGYNFGQVQGVVGQLRSQFPVNGNSPLVTTTEPANFYLPPSSGGPLPQQQWLGLLQMSAWLFPTEDLYSGSGTNLSQTVTNAANLYYGILYQISLAQNGATQFENKLLVYKESFWPNTFNGQDIAAQQVQYFQQLANVSVGPTQPSPPNPAATHVYFVWGEAFNQYWKNDGDNGLLGPYWGYNTTTTSPTNFTTQPEPIVQAGSTGLQSVYTQPYPWGPPPNFGSGSSAPRPQR